MRDYLTTLLLLGIMGVIIVLLGGWLLGRSGLWIGLIISITLSLISFFFSREIALKSSKAQPLDENRSANLHKMVEELSTQMGIPKPDLYYMESSQANAFATGRSPKNSAVVVTTGLINLLEIDELKGVIAHELGHIKSRDILTATIASVLAAFITFAARMRFINSNRGAFTSLIIAITVPIAAAMLRMAISRQREYVADATSASVLGSGNPLADALIKIQKSSINNEMDINPSFSNLFISNPFGKLEGISRLFATHPPTDERVARLRNM